MFGLYLVFIFIKISFQWSLNRILSIRLLISCQIVTSIPERLDFIFYTSSVMSTAKSFTLQTEIMSNERLESYGLLWNETKNASDHFPIVADFTFLYP